MEDNHKQGKEVPETLQTVSARVIALLRAESLAAKAVRTSEPDALDDLPMPERQAIYKRFVQGMVITEGQGRKARWKR